MKAIRVSYNDLHEPGDHYPVRKWKCEFTLNDTIELRPLTAAAILDMAIWMKANEWAALQTAMQNPGHWCIIL